MTNQIALTLALMLVGGAAMSQTKIKVSFASEAVEKAAQAPEIAAVIREGNKPAAATVDQDADAFAANQAAELMVNSPANRVLTGAQAVGAFKAGLIDYSSLERVIEYAAMRPTGEVLLMGAEHVTPRGKTRNAGKTETYRVTEIWRKVDGDWKLSVRQATISEIR